MSQFVETRVGDFLGRVDSIPQPSQPRVPSTTTTTARKETPVRDPDIKLTADQIFTF